MQIYATQFHEQHPAIVVNNLMAALPAEMIDKAQRFKKWQSAYSFVLGKHLLMAALRAHGFPTNLTALQYTQHGKPYFQDGPDFNISHSDNLVVCVVSGKGKVGIDVEERRNISIDEFSSQFCEEEWQAITNATYPLYMFYHYWTAKESVIKADGRGLTLPLNSLKISASNIILVDNTWWNIRSVDFFNNHACHLASATCVETVELRELSIDMLATINQL